MKLLRFLDMLIGAVIGLMISSMLHGQIRSKTYVMTDSDGTTTVLNFYIDDVVKGHYYIIDQDMKMAEIWTTDDEWIIKATTETNSEMQMSLPELIGEDYELLEFDLFEANPDE